MTSPHVSEQEVEAAARAIHKIWYDKWPNPECTQCMEVARAALTAAAQVRERARPPAEIERLCQVEGMARYVLEKFQKDEAQGYRSRDRQFAIELLGKFLTAEQKPTLMPIYGATEPDSGPDVLGERKE